MAGELPGLSSRRVGLILPWKTQYPSGCGAHKMHLPTGSTLDRVIRVLVVLRNAFGQPPLNRTAGVRAIEEERTHLRTVYGLAVGSFEVAQKPVVSIDPSDKWQILPSSASPAIRDRLILQSTAIRTTIHDTCHDRQCVGSTSICSLVSASSHPPIMRRHGNMRACEPSQSSTASSRSRSNGAVDTWHHSAILELSSYRIPSLVTMENPHSCSKRTRSDR